MPQFFIILLKINVVLILFAAAYYLILRRLTFYTLNRIFLAFGILFATIYPFINLTEFFFRQLNSKAAEFVPKMNQKVTELAPSDFITSNWQLISILFYVGVVVMAGRLMLQFISLYIMHKKSKPGAVGNYPVRILGEPVSPFSFWQTVYINPSLHQENELNTILEHEKVHVKQWHSLDIIMAELSVVFYWFNPGVWMMKKAVKENLEFITDQKILNKGIIDRKTYQYSLLDVGNLTPSVAIVNNFNLSDLKKRIKMMNVKRSSPISLSRYLLITPVLLVTTLAFTVSKKEIANGFKPIKQALIRANVIEAEPIAEAVVSPGKVTPKVTKRNKGAKAIKKDSSETISYTVKNLFLYTDTVESLPKLPESITVVKRVQHPPLVKFEGRPLSSISFSDSVKGTDVLRAIENLRINVKSITNGVPLEDAQAPKKTVIVVRGVRATDSLLRKAKPINYSFNGKVITQEEFHKIDPNDLESVSIKTKEPVSEIIVIGRAKGTKLN